MVIFFLLYCSLVNVNAQTDGNGELPVISTIYGNVMGSVLKSRQDRTFLAFKGIPYAKPPIGELRFKAPEEPEPWTDILNTTQDPNMCVQQNFLFEQHPEVEGDEDCLYINVYTPVVTNLERRINNDLLPVMVFIHYGAFMSGSSASDVLGPEYFMDKEVLLVTFNYRVGIFGFLSTYDDAAPGNWAFKDQTAALKWVRSNIKQFGGDAERVTIFGQSAGAGSVHYHILSPQSRGLFQAAITQSGSALALWAKPQREVSLAVAKLQADAVGCNSNVTTDEMVECLRTIPAATLVESMNLFRFMRSEPLTIYLPTIEFQTKKNPEPFVTKDPLEIIENGEFANVPWMIGVTPDEGILRAAPFVRQTDLLDAINANFNTYLIEMLYLSLSVDEEDLSTTWAKIKEFYFLNNDGIDVSDPESIQGLINVYSDRGFLYPAYQMSLLHRHKGHENVWFYDFSYKGNKSYGEIFAATENQIDFDWGISHCDDLLYLFNSPKLFPNFQLNSTDLEVSNLMLNLFTNFSTYLDPNPGLTSFEEGFRWTPLPSTESKDIMENSDLHYLKLSGKYNANNNGDSLKITMSKEYHPNRMSFWINLPLQENIDNLF